MPAAAGILSVSWFVTGHEKSPPVVDEELGNGTFPTNSY
jgi:hypothetical protein